MKTKINLKEIPIEEWRVSYMDSGSYATEIEDYRVCVRETLTTAGQYEIVCTYLGRRGEAVIKGDYARELYEHLKAAYEAKEKQDKLEATKRVYDTFDLPEQ